MNICLKTFWCHKVFLISLRPEILLQIVGFMVKGVSTKKILIDRIIATATEAFVAKGISQVKMDDIAASLSISKRTLYEQFSNKETLLLECIRVGQQEQRKYMEKVAKESANVLETIMHFYEMAMDQLRTTNPMFFRDLRKYPVVHDYLEECRRNNEKAGVFFFEKGVEQGIFRNDVNFELVHMLCHEQMNLMCDEARRGNFGLVQVFDSIILVTMRGISTERGLAIIDDYVTKLRNQKKQENQ